VNKDVYLGMRPGDLDDKPYAKYWQPEMSPLPAHAAEAVLQGPASQELGFPHEQAGQLLAPGYLPLETGYTRLANGQVFVSVLTHMPGVTGEMIDWWFGWHGIENERYKLWHPRAHMKTSMKNPLSAEPGLTDCEKYVGNVSYVEEYIGGENLPISIAFQTPAENYLDEAGFAQAGIQTAVCARVGITKSNLNFSRLIHLIRETEDGCEMRSRFWLGDVAFGALPERNIVNRLLGSRFIARRAASLETGRDLLVHCSMEMNHLASFLPDLYRDYNPQKRDCPKTCANEAISDDHACLSL